MALTLYDLAGANDERFSPHCWRARMAIAHKGLDVDCRGVNFVDIAKIEGGNFKTVPVMEDNGACLHDSFAIARYLETTYPQAPSLFGTLDGIVYASFIQSWANSILHPVIAGCIILDIYDRLTCEDQQYFRQSREKRLGKTLEQAQDGREERREDFYTRLTPVRMMLAAQPFLGGDEPRYVDYILFGSLQWANNSSSFKVLEEADPINEWFERCLDLHGAIGRTA